MTLFYGLLVAILGIIGSIVTGMAVGTATTLFDTFDPTIPQALVIMLIGGVVMSIVCYIIFFGGYVAGI